MIMAEIEESNLSLEKIISEVDYVKLGEDYIPSTFAIKFINFIKLVNGEAGEENKSPLFHYEKMVQNLLLLLVKLLLLLNI